MALKLNVAQINSAAKGNNDLRETLTGVYNELQSVYQQIGSGPIQKVDATANKFSGPPATCGLSVTGANGQFNVSITLPQQAGGSTAPANATNAPIYQELSSSPVANFSSGVATYPLSTNTSYVFPNPGATLCWRLRSSYDQKTFNSYQVQPGGAVAAGLQTSAATQPNLSLNQSNFATVDSVGAGGTATVRIYGSGGVGTSWSRIVGNSSQVIPAGTILNVTYGSSHYVAWDGTQYQLKPTLTQTFPDGWIPVGVVSVISNGSGLVLPTIKAVIVSGSIIGYNVTAGGNDITGPLTFTIADSGGGTGATVGPDTVTSGVLTSLGAGNPGSGYTGATTVTATGGISGGVGGGGGNTGNNGGRLFGLTVQGD